MFQFLHMQMILAMWMPGAMEWVIIGALGLLIFGKRLPEVGRSIGQGIVEFKKGLKGVQDDIDEASSPKPESLADSKKTPSLSEPAQQQQMQSDEAAVKQADPTS